MRNVYQYLSAIQHAKDTSTAPTCFVYIQFCVFKMPPSIENPIDCEMHIVICFLSAKDMKQLKFTVRFIYRQNIMSDGMVYKWVGAFKDGWNYVHDKVTEKVGGTSVITHDLVHKVYEKVKMNRCFMISSLSDEFPQVSRSVLY